MYTLSYPRAVLIAVGSTGMTLFIAEWCGPNSIMLS